MAMNSTTLKASVQTRIYNSLKAVFTPMIPVDLSPAAKASIDTTWQDMASSISDSMIDIVLHIQTQAVINTALTAPTVAVTSVSGVTTGLGVSGPGAGAVTNPAAIGTIT